MQAHLREGKQVVEDAEGVRACEDEPEKGWKRPEVLHCYRIGCLRLDGGVVVEKDGAWSLETDVRFAKWSDVAGVTQWDQKIDASNI